MAKVPTDPSKTELEQKILWVLRDAGSPVKTAQLVKECQVPKKELNQVLYRMKDERHVSCAGPGMWRLEDGGTRDTLPAEGAPPSQAEKPQQDPGAPPEKPGSQLSEQQEEIYKLLEASGPRKALNIAKSLGMKTAKEVNPNLYDMRRRHLLDLDPNSQAWTIYRPEDSGGRKPSGAVIYQQNTISVIAQNGPNSHISIENSEAVQIGHGNVLVQQQASGAPGFTAPLPLPPWAPAEAAAQEALAGSSRSQDIRVERSVLRRVQMGHGNEMHLQGSPARTGHSPCGSPPVSAPPAGPEASFEIPGPPPEGDVGVLSQRVHISSCFLTDTAIGNSNRMSVGLGAAGPGGGAGPAEAREDPGEPAEDAAPHSEAAEPRGKSPHDVHHADPDMSTFTAHLEAVTLESIWKDPEATEDGP